MAKDLLARRMTESALRRENSGDQLKTKASLHSLPISENHLNRNGAKMTGSAALHGHRPRLVKHGRSSSAERAVFPHGSSYSSIGSSKESSAGSRKDLISPEREKRRNNLYEKLLWDYQFDEASKKDFAMGRRIGFYKFKSELGSGNFSKVKMAMHQLTKEHVAVKIISKNRLDAKTQKMLQREIRIMDSLSHPNLVRLFEVLETGVSIHLIMEVAPEGELFVKLSEEGPYKESQAKGIFSQVASAVQYMHTQSFIHRDLKAENVFFANHQITTRISSTETVTYPMVKVGDFGFATQVNSMDQHLTTFCGSPPYAAPELFKDDHYVGPAVDIWALGILLYFLVTGSMPFKGTTVASLKNSILEGKFDLPNFVSESCMELVRGILRKKPEWRLTLQQIRDSRWLSGMSWPSPDTKYRPFPTKQPFNEKVLTEEETKVRGELQILGIGSELLEEQIENGNRSSVVGAFRILMHKATTCEVRKDLKKVVDVDCRSAKSEKSNRWVRISSPEKSLTFTDHLEDKNEIYPNKKRKKSKFCTIL